MKKFIVIAFCSLLFNYCSQSKVELTDLTKSIIELYDEVYPYKKEDIGEIVILIHKETEMVTEYSYIGVYGNDKDMEVCGENFRGRTRYMKYPIYVFGEENEMFYKSSFRENIECRDTDEYINYDPIYWRIGLNADTTVCELYPREIIDSVTAEMIRSIFETFRKSKGKL